MADEVPHKHHIVSAFHLAQFTDSKRREGSFWVFDKSGLPVDSKTPNEVGWKEDFNMVEIDGVPPMIIEEGFGKFETKCAPMFKRVIETGLWPRDNQQQYLTDYVALAITRVPAIRDAISNFVEGVVTAIGFQDHERIFNQTWYIDTILKGWKIVFTALTLRKWTIWTTEPGAIELICSDCPVAFLPPQKWMLGIPPWMDPGRMLIMPMGPQTLLVSKLEQEVVQYEMNDKDVGCMNYYIAEHADQIYAHKQDWHWLNGQDQLCNWQDFLNQQK